VKIRFRACLSSPGFLEILQVSGCTVINAFDARPRFEAEMMRRLDANITAFFYRTGAGEWLGLRMEIIGAAMLVLTSLILVLSRDRCARPPLPPCMAHAPCMRSRENHSTTYAKWVGDAVFGRAKLAWCSATGSLSVGRSITSFTTFS
jgi:hypothetical protein